MVTNFDGPLIFGDPKAIAFIKKIKKEDISKRKITICYKDLIDIGFESERALKIIESLINIKKKK